MKHFYKFADEAWEAGDIMGGLTLPQKQHKKTRGEQRWRMHRKAAMQHPIGHCLYWGVKGSKYILNKDFVCIGAN